MKILKKISLLSALAIFGLSFFVAPIQAQKRKASQDLDVFIGEIVKKSDKSISMNIEIENRTGWNFSDITYEIILKKNYNGSPHFVASKIIKEENLIESFQSIQKEILFDSDYKINKGNYLVELYAYNGREFAGKSSELINVEDGNYSVDITLEKDSFKIITPDGKTYSEKDSLPIFNPGEEVKFQFKLNDLGMTKLINKAEISTYKYSVVSKKIEDISSRVLVVNNGNDIEVISTTPSQPGIYVNYIKLLHPNGNKYTTTAVLPYFVKGESFLILNASLDEISYENGGNAKVRLRFAKIFNFKDSKLSAIVNISSNGTSCGKKDFSEEIVKTANEIRLDVPIKSNCPNPVLEVSISKDGKVLDSEKFSYIKTNSIDKPNHISQNNFNWKKILITIFVIVIIIVAIVLIIKSIKNKRQEI